MSHYNGKKIVAGIFAMTMAVTLTQPMFAEELNTEIPSAGASMVIDDYISNNGSDEDLVKYLPAAEKTENKEKIQQAMNAINTACSCLSSYKD